MSKLLRKSPTSLSSTAAKNLSIDDIHLRVHIQGRGTPNNGCPARTVDGLCTAIAAPANNRDPAQPDGDLGRGCVGEWIGKATGPQPKRNRMATWGEAASRPPAIQLRRPAPNDLDDHRGRAHPRHPRVEGLAVHIACAVASQVPAPASAAPRTACCAGQRARQRRRPRGLSLCTRNSGPAAHPRPLPFSAGVPTPRQPTVRSTDPSTNRRYHRRSEYGCEYESTVPPSIRVRL